MSAQPLDGLAYDHAYTPGRIERPYAAVSTDDLVDALEGQHERGEALSEDLVFEALARLVVAEGLAMHPAQG